jgi:hypothetical protein
MRSRGLHLDSRRWPDRIGCWLLVFGWALTVILIAALAWLVGGLFL